MSNLPINVLIIDDDAGDAQLAHVALRKAESQTFASEHAHSMDEAFEMLQNQQFDIVLLDLGLPGSFRLETLAKFRRCNDRLPVIVVSGIDDECVAIEALGNDAQDYICKNDINTHNLSRAIRYAIQRQNSIIENRQLLAKVQENELILNRKNERLARLYETAHTFVDNVSHEFRTPLTVIKEYIALVRDGTMGDLNSEQVKFLQVAEDRADDLNTMVDDMLDVSKLENGLLHVCRKRQTIGEIIDRVIPSLSRKAGVKNLHLEVEVPTDLPTIYCDGEKIARVLINLAVNAMKFTAPNRSVRVWAELDESDIRVGVSDQGPGIAKDCLQSIFERFRQTDVAAMSSTKGFGLGLNIAKELVTLNLGKIHVESKTGEGSTFSFTVPIYEPGEICERYIKTIGRRLDSVALVIATSPTEDEDVAASVDAFLSHLVRANDLCFRTLDNQWLILLPEPAAEAEAFIQRATAERESVNRNRPQGPLPPIEYRLERAWSNLRIRREEVVGRVQSLVGEGELSHA